MKIYKLKKALVWLIFRPICEAFGIPRWCRRPALGGLDSRLARYLNFRNGVFVEAGANDGYSQSNTFFLEKGLKWQGILVEAIPELYRKCKKKRKASLVINGGLVANSDRQKTITFHYANLMSIAEGAMEASALENHLQRGIQCGTFKDSYSIDVPAITFEEILVKADFPKIDFLSVDLEGYELEALKGWNFLRHRPKYILIEVRDLNRTDCFFKAVSYARIDQLTHHDYLYQDILTMATPPTNGRK